MGHPEHGDEGLGPVPVHPAQRVSQRASRVAGAILLIAAKRQDLIAAALPQHDYETNLAAKDDIDAVLEIINRPLEMIAEFQEILRRLDSKEATER